MLHVGKPECVCCICCLRWQYAGCICFWSFVSSASLFLGARACVRCWSHAFAVLQDHHFIRVARSASSVCCTTAQYSWVLEVRVVNVLSLSRLLVSRQHVTTLVDFARCCFSFHSYSYDVCSIMRRCMIQFKTFRVHGLQNKDVCCTALCLFV